MGSQLSSTADTEAVKNVVLKVLKSMTTIAKAAGTVNPIFNVASALLSVTVYYVDDEAFKKLKHEFENINQNLNVISKLNNKILQAIKNAAVGKQYTDIENNLRNQFNTFSKIVEAKPEHLQRMKDNFIEYYANNKDDQNMNNLYEGVMGKGKLFSQSIIKVYREHSKGDKQVMKDVCNHLSHLFVIGYIPMMSYYDFKGDDMESRIKEWEKKIKELQRVMGEWM